MKGRAYLRLLERVDLDLVVCGEVLPLRHLVLGSLQSSLALLLLGSSVMLCVD